MFIIYAGLSFITNPIRKAHNSDDMIFMMGDTLNF